MPEAIAHAENLSRFYGLILGLNNVSFNLRAGLTGLVGPNGAGKTTLFRLLTGQIQPSSGRITVFGAAPWKNPAIQARLAYCPEGEDVPAGLRPLDWLGALGMISGLSARESDTRARAMLDRVKFPASHLGKRLTALSKGQRQRVKLAQCLLHHPALVILDEPMNGLDPMGREDFGNVLRELARDGTSVLISSHILHDLEALCGEFLFLRGGRMPRASLEAGSPEARQRWPDALTFRCESPEKLARYFFDQNLLQGCDLEPATGTLHVRWSDPDRFHQNFHRFLSESGVKITEVRRTTAFLEKTIQTSLV